MNIKTFLVGLRTYQHPCTESKISLAQNEICQIKHSGTLTHTDRRIGNLMIITGLISDA